MQKRYIPSTEINKHYQFDFRFFSKVNLLLNENCKVSNAHEPYYLPIQKDFDIIEFN